METPEAVYLAAVKLMGQRRFDEAEKLLRSSRNAARDRNDARAAATLSSFLGSCLMADGRYKEALDAYLDAESDSPDDPFLKMLTASHLQRYLGQSNEALSKLILAMPELNKQKSAYHAAQSLLGEIYLSSGRIDEAHSAFTRMAARDVIEGLASPSLALYLVERLIEAEQLPSGTEEYLDWVISRASVEGNNEVSRMAEDFKARTQKIRGD